MKLGRVLSVESETMPGTEFRGQITAVFPAADQKNRSFDVEVTIPNSDYRLRPNMIVSLRVNTRQDASAQTVVPLNAVLKAKDKPTGYTVFVVTDEGGRQVARRRDVELGEAYGNTVAVTAGVKQGEFVITTGSTMVLDGVQVKVIP
jgi:RND family efflux transporter MFP subunit